MKLLAKIMLLVLTLFLGIAMTGCNEDDPITAPDNADWSVVISRINDEYGAYNHNVTVKWIGSGSAYQRPYSLLVHINGIRVDLTEWNGYWLGKTNLDYAQSANIRLTINGRKIAETKLRTVSQASVFFPASYSPTSDADVWWSLSSSNQVQIVSAVSTAAAGNASDDFERVISSFSRSFAFPKGVLDDYGYYGTYILEVTQMNLKTSRRVLFVSSHTQFKEYGPYGQSMNQVNQQDQFCMRILERL